MAETTNIEWADATFNPWWGCVKVSAGCDSCYAERDAKRYGQPVWGPEAPRRFFGDKHWNEPLKWARQAQAAGRSFRVFCASMADVCEDRPDLVVQRARLMALIEATPALTWMLLTKRPQNFASMFWPGRDWPRNVWAMTTAENMDQMINRAHYLRDLPCSVRGISYEPALGGISLGPTANYIDWVICGGESGPKARIMNPTWARRLRDDCAAGGVAFFFKQWGEWVPVTNFGPGFVMHTGPGERVIADGEGGHWLMRKAGKKAAGRLLDGRYHDELPVTGLR